MRKRAHDPKAFGKVAVLMGETTRFASTARCVAERPATDGRAGGYSSIAVSPGTAGTEATDA